MTRGHDDEDADYDATPYAVMDRLEVDVEIPGPLGVILGPDGGVLLEVWEERLPFGFHP